MLGFNHYLTGVWVDHVAGPWLRYITNNFRNPLEDVEADWEFVRRVVFAAFSLGSVAFLFVSTVVIGIVDTFLEAIFIKPVEILSAA